MQNALTNLMGAAGTASAWTPPAVNSGGQRQFRHQGIRRDVDGFESIGRYGVEFKDDEAGGTYAEFNSARSRNSGAGNPYPFRQLPAIFGLTKDVFEAALNALIIAILQKHGKPTEDGTAIDIDFQPYNTGTNLNYVTLDHFMIQVSPTNFLVIHGLYKPEVTMSTPEWVANQYTMAIAKKSRARNVVERVETPIEINGKKLIVLVDRQEAAARAHLPGIKMARMVDPNASLQPSQGSALSADALLGTLTE